MEGRTPPAAMQSDKVDFPPRKASVDEAEGLRMLFPLFQAAAQGDLEGIRGLVASKADVNLASPFDQRTALHLAAANGHLEVVRYLVEGAGARMLRDRSGVLPIHEAKANDHSTVRTFLQDQKQDVDDKVEGLVKQRNLVCGLIDKDGIFAPDHIQSEMREVYENLGLHESYFEHFSAAEIARHMQTIMAAKQAAVIRGDEQLRVAMKDDQSAFFLTSLHPHAQHRETVEDLGAYLLEAAVGKKLSYTINFVASSAPLFSNSSRDNRVGIYYVSCSRWEETTGGDHTRRPTFPDLDLADDLDLRQETDLQRIAPARFLKAADAHTLATYQRLVERVVLTRSTAVEAVPSKDFPGGEADGFVMLVAVYRVGGKAAIPLVESLHELMWNSALEPQRLACETFANGSSVYRLDFPCASAPQMEHLKASLRFVQQIKRVAGLSGLLWNRVIEGQITPEQTVYARAAVKFAYAFFPRERYVPQYTELQGMLHDPTNKAKLDELYLQTVSEIITIERVYAIVVEHIDLVAKCFEDFRRCARDGAKPSWNEELANAIDERLGGKDPLGVHVLRMILKFNQSILITNFFRSDSPPASVAFRLDPKVVLAGRPKSLYPETPFGIYFVSGRLFHGFHVRFREIARGGIRLIRSPDMNTWFRNNTSLFEECFNLAYTQQLKNKDIPEGGAKGVILLDPTSSSMSQVFSQDCFLKYIDALLDCMLLPPGVHSQLRNEELLFFGPDENTADCMDLGCSRAKDRGFKYWKAITTGKSVSLGGVPHDVYGITTRGVRTYVRELYRVLNLDETQVTKFQTGGPDGDLGSNEILQSCDRTVSIVDGSGVAYDPNGLARAELERLARARQTMCHFNKALLGAGGFLVTIDETDVVLPDGSKWRSGLELRNDFVFTKYAKADLFVPCGGRPATVREGNVKRLFSGDKPVWKMVVEGANLFFTAGARTALEDAGVHVFKDSSANKGGVTSSSFEVLASLCMPDRDHCRLLTKVDETSELPNFYLQYVDAICQRIEDNCTNEFGVIWRATQDASEPMSKAEASARVSKQINELTDHIARAELSQELQVEILRLAIPELLVEKFGVDSLKEHMPPAYATATVAYYLASKYVYEHGITGNNAFAFHLFMQRFSGALTDSQSPPDSPAPPDSPGHWSSECRPHTLSFLER